MKLCDEEVHGAGRCESEAVLALDGEAWDGCNVATLLCLPHAQALLAILAGRDSLAGAFTAMTFRALR